MAAARKKRPDGEASRQRILDAAAQIAGERGYEGTSINLVSQRSGLPASSIYWHFRDKDELIAAVIDRSFTRWVEALDGPVGVPPDATADTAFHLAMRRTGEAIATFSDFLRLGLLLVLERRPHEPTARAKFVEVRRTTAERLQGFYDLFFPNLEPVQRGSLVLLTMALADGLFIAEEVEHVDLTEAFDLLATAVLATARHLAV